MRIRQSAVAAIRSIRRRELFRIAVAELLHVADPEQAGRSLSDVAMAALEGALRVARSAVDPQGSVDFAVIGMGRFGGRELGFASDIDVMFVYEPRPGRRGRGGAPGRRGRRRGAAPAADGSLAATRRWTSTPTCGRRASRARSSARSARTRRTTSDGRPRGRRRPCCVPTWSPATRASEQRSSRSSTTLRWIGPLTERRRVTEVRRLKARMESERLPRGADPNLHTKLGRGGLSDVEWVVQLLQMDARGRRSVRCARPAPWMPSRRLGRRA